MAQIHPGEYIYDSFLSDTDIPRTHVAKMLDVSESTLSRLLAKKIDVSHEMACRLEFVFGRSASSWLNMQAAYSLEKARKAIDTSKLTPFWPSQSTEHYETATDHDHSSNLPSA